ncbi:hypothetical protein FSPOR_9478 [Fusarium sporotrichioides]|uniref:Uncharacterized protein n=1 Tax=Fusarium sporotrichioides TaxID=5514 RepID=A0A395RQX1_FUSSP|nr:hypothetical protein FSPOR_9478 [Fusarium sporotrichioides]
MFEVPQAKRVRREDLNASDDGSDDGLQDAELRAKLHAQMVKSLGMDIDIGPVSPSSAKDSNSESTKRVEDDAMDVDHNEEPEEDHEEEFVFRLFSKAPATQKVVLEEDTGPTGTGVFVRGRPLSYYMVTDIPAQQKQEYAMASISGDEVLARSHNRAWGLELPWKVTKLTVTRKASPNGKVQGDETRGKRKPGKKQRISLRKRAKEREEKEVAEAKKMADKEEQIKDKKKRMNRLKKLRKRAKAKGQKQTSKGEEDGQSDDSDGDSAGSE